MPFGEKFTNQTPYPYPKMAEPKYDRLDHAPPITWTGRRYISVSSGTELEFTNETDQHGNPAGGRVNGCGFHIYWQNGPVNQEQGEGPDGAFIEDVLEAVINRLTFYQEGNFACKENVNTLAALLEARESMDARRKDRATRGVLGQHLK